MSNTTQELFLDEIEAIATETLWALGLDDQGSPFQSEEAVHCGEGGCTTIYRQAGRVVGLSTRCRDDNNRTLLICVDLRQP